MTATATALTPGQHIVFPVPGSPATVTLMRTDNGKTGQAVYLVTVAQGAHRPEGWTHTYGDETTARFEATRAAQLLHRYGTADAIQARHEHLTTVIAEQIRRMPRNMHDRKALAAAEAEADSLATLDSMALLADLRWQFAG